jgi:hypothetical protein
MGKEEEKYLWQLMASIMKLINSHVSIGSSLVTKKGCKIQFTALMIKVRLTKCSFLIFFKVYLSTNGNCI